MKNRFYSLIGTVAVLLAVVTIAGAQQSDSLADYARTAKKKPAQAKTAPRVYDNDNLPRDASLSVVGNAPADPDATKTADADKKTDADKTDPKAADKAENKDAAQIKPGQSAEDRQKAIDAIKKKLDAQQDKINLLTRELDVLQREYQLKVSEFYSDTARRAQNPNGLFEDDQKYKQQIEEKQKAVDDAKEQLSNMQEEARRSGAPNSVLE